MASARLRLVLGRLYAWTRVPRLIAGLRDIGKVLGLVRRWQAVVVVLGLFVSSLFELFGLTMIIPLLATVTDLGQGRLGLVNALREFVESLGLPFSPSTFLTLIVVGLSLKAAVTIAVMRYVGRLVAKIGRRTQMRVIRSLLGARWGFFVRQPMGRLANAAGPEAAAPGECFLSLASIIAAGLQTVLFLFIAALISPELAALTLAVTLAMLIGFGRVVRKSREAERLHRRKVRGMGAKFIDAVGGIKPLRAMGRTEHFNVLFEADARALAQALRTRVFSGEYASELQEPLIGTLIAVGFLYAATHTTLAGHELIVMAILLVRTIRTARPIQRGMQRFAQDYDRLTALERFLDKVEAEADLSPGTAYPLFEHDIELDDVRFSYAARPVLDGISLVVPRGQITTVAGRSGVGKSTIVDLIAGLYRPSEGRILVDGRDLAEFDLQAWRHLLGYVPQDVTLFHASVRDNVALGEPGFAEEEIVAALRAAGALSFVETLDDGLDHIVGERGLGLSGGQRQRIAIARALLRKPRILILDEATTGLDQPTEASICATVGRLCREDGLTVLAISHQPAWQTMADRLYWMKDSSTAELVPPRRQRGAVDLPPFEEVAGPVHGEKG